MFSLLPGLILSVGDVLSTHGSSGSSSSREMAEQRGSFSHSLLSLSLRNAAGLEFARLESLNASGEGFAGVAQELGEHSGQIKPMTPCSGSARSSFQKQGFFSSCVQERWVNPGIEVADPCGALGLISGLSPGQ